MPGWEAVVVSAPIGRQQRFPDLGPHAVGFFQRDVGDPESSFLPWQPVADAGNRGNAISVVDPADAHRIPARKARRPTALRPMQTPPPRPLHREHPTRPSQGFLTVGRHRNS